MIETKPMKNIRVIEVETGRMMNIPARRMMIYRIASIIEMTDKILKNEIEMIASMPISFLMMKVDDCRDFLMNEIDHCRNFLIFQKFLELLIEMKMRVIVSENSSLLTIREMIS
jgi:hypothetical protein